MPEKMTLARCLACQQGGVPVQLDDTGFLIEHPGRTFRCRVPRGAMPLPDPGLDVPATEIVVGRYLQLLFARNTPAFWEARNTGQEDQFWEELYGRPAQEQTAEVEA